MAKKREKTEIEKLESKLTMRQRMFCYYYAFGFEVEVEGSKFGFVNKLNEDDDEDDSADFIEQAPKEVRYIPIANATQSYAKAFSKDPKKQANTCGVEGSKLLRNPRVRRYLRLIIDESGFNDEMMDARLRQIVFEGDSRSSIMAIKQFNELRRRISPQEQPIVIDLSKRARELARPFLESDNDDAQ